MQWLASSFKELLPLSFKFQMFPERCDEISTCSKTAKHLIATLLKSPMLHLESDTIKLLLDHEQLLSVHHCNVLALMTVREAQRILIMEGSNKAQFGTTEANIHNVLEKLQAFEKGLLASPYTSTSYLSTENLEILVLTHKGDGMAVLERQSKARVTIKNRKY